MNLYELIYNCFVVLWLYDWNMHSVYMKVALVEINNIIETFRFFRHYNFGVK
jgi:hypothetical protein